MTAWKVCVITGGPVYSNAAKIGNLPNRPRCQKRGEMLHETKSQDDKITKVSCERKSHTSRCFPWDGKVTEQCRNSLSKHDKKGTGNKRARTPSRIETDLSKARFGKKDRYQSMWKKKVRPLCDAYMQHRDIAKQVRLLASSAVLQPPTHKEKTAPHFQEAAQEKSSVKKLEGLQLRRLQDETLSIRKGIPSC